MRLISRAIVWYRASVPHRRDLSHCASRARVADRSRCRMISHDRTADQSHEYLGCNDFFGQGSMKACLSTSSVKTPLSLAMPHLSLSLSLSTSKHVLQFRCLTRIAWFLEKDQGNPNQNVSASKNRRLVPQLPSLPCMSPLPAESSNASSSVACLMTTFGVKSAPCPFKVPVPCAAWAELDDPLDAPWLLWLVFVASAPFPAVAAAPRSLSLEASGDNTGLDMLSDDLVGSGAVSVDGVCVSEAFPEQGKKCDVSIFCCQRGLGKTY